jgi:hypothetical protein
MAAFNPYSSSSSAIAFEFISRTLDEQDLRAIMLALTLVLYYSSP